MLYSNDSCQNRVYADQHHMTLPWGQVLTYRGYMFLAERRLKYIFLTHTAHEISCAYEPGTDFGREKAAFFTDREGSCY